MAKVSLRNYNREIEAMVDRGQLDEAIAHCQHILKTFPKHLETYRLLGKAFLEYKRYKDAVDIFSRVLGVEPNDFVANVGMSIIRDEENKLDDAIWHMERAFEVQSANPAIQGELQRLYGRREGVQPPRIRMTRGALAHMYMQGELYPQAISEVKSVLSDDAGRTDMQVLMARAYFKSGQKNEAADTASAVLRRYPYCLDANRILVEILGSDRPENSQLYRQRVIELDPYAAQVSGSIFDSSEVGDAAITLDHFEWDGKPIGGQPEWDGAKALSLDSGRATRGPEAQPDWLTNGGFADSAPPQATPKVVPPLPASDSTFDFAASMPAMNEPKPVAQPNAEADIPDFLRAAGWGQSTGTFDESKMTFADEPASSAAVSDAMPIAQGDMPDWLKAMAPPQAVEPAQSFEQASNAPAEEEELPDWINNIGKTVLPASAAVAASDELDWLNPSAQPSAQTADDQFDWMKQLDGPEAQPEALDQPDWMKQLDQPAAAQLDTPDWMKQLDQPASQAAATDQPDWLAGLDNASDSTPASATLEDQADWMKNFGGQAEETPAGDEFDFLNELTAPAAEPTPAPSPASTPAANLEDLGKSQSDIDESLAWFESLAAKQGATEGLLIKPEDHKEVEPDWIQKIKNSSQPAVESTALPAPVAEQAPAPVPSANVEELGKSQSDSDIDESLAWFESLAAKQGATEGLLIKPEDRKEVEPDWIQKIKNSSQPAVESTPVPVPVAEQAPAPVPSANVEELGKSQSDIDESLAWFESLAAKQGATEGLLIKPEDRKEVEPDWIQKIKNSSQPAAESAPVAEPTPAPVPAANVEELGKSQSDIDESLAWFESLATKQGATEGLLIKPEDRKEVEPDWIQKIKNSSQPAVESTPVPAPVAEQAPAPVPSANVEELGKSQSDIDESLAWFESLAAKQGATEGLLIKPEDRKDVEPDWVKQVKSAPAPEPTPAPVPAANVEELGKSQSDIDESLAWFESLAAKQGATEGLLIKPEDRKEVEPDWVKQVKSAPVTEPTPAQPETFEQQPVDDTAAWLRSLDEEDAKAEPVSVNDDTTAWLQTLDEPEPVAQAVPADDMPSWLHGLDEEKAPVAESAVPQSDAAESDWMNAIEEPVAESVPEAGDGDVPSWLKGIEEESSVVSVALPQDDLPAWMRDETGEVVAEPTKIEPTRPTDWHPIDEKRPEPPAPIVAEEPKPVAPVQEKPKPAPVKKAAPKPAEPKPEPYREPVLRIRGTGMLTMPQLVDPILDSARTELTRSNIPGALETYAKLIKKGRFLDETIFDLREALYRYPVEVSIWQSLGDAYMRANRLQDALDAYTKAEELLR